MEAPKAFLKRQTSASADLQPGQNCAFWQESGRQGGARTKSEHCVVGVFRDWDRGLDCRRDGANAWVESAGRLRLDSAGQTRSGALDWCPGRAPLDQPREGTARTRATPHHQAPGDPSTYLPHSSGSEIDQPNVPMITGVAEVLATEVQSDHEDEHLVRHLPHRREGA